MRQKLVTAVSLLWMSISSPGWGGVDDSPIDELMEKVQKESIPEDKPVVLPNEIRASANTTNEPTIVDESEHLETDKSTSEVKVGARHFAIENGCEFMQVYRVATDSDFTETLQLIKYRSRLLGAEFLTISHHSEGNYYLNGHNFFIPTYLMRSYGRSEVPLIRTVMVAEMYDCGDV